MKALKTAVLLATLASCGTPDSKLNSAPNSTPNNTINNTTPVSCTFDADCADGEACEAQVCVATCSGDQDCAAGEFCGPGVNTEQLVCQADGRNNPTNINPNNVSPGPLLYLAAIRSTTTDEEACFAEDPGPDLFGVGLEDFTGAQLGWGRVVWEEIQFDGNAFTDSSVIDGNGPDLFRDVCPDTFDGNVVSLGCDGAFIIVDFVDFSGQPIALDATAEQVIRVYEWGGQCTTGSIDDTYSVDICADTEGGRSGDISSCRIQVIIDGAGESSSEVGGF